MFSKSFGILLVAVSVWSWEPEQFECMQELNLNETKVAEFSLNSSLPEDNDDLIKFAECYWTKMKFFDDSGNVDPKVIETRMRQTVQKDRNSSEYLTKLLNTLSEGIKECSGHQFDGSKGVIAIKVENCIDKFMKNYY